MPVVGKFEILIFFPNLGAQTYIPWYSVLQYYMYNLYITCRNWLVKMTFALCTYVHSTWRLISLSFKPDMIDGRIRSRWNFIFDDEDFKTLQVKGPSQGPSGFEIKQIKVSQSESFFSSRWIGEIECNFVLVGMFRWKMSSTLPCLPSESRNQNLTKTKHLLHLYFFVNKLSEAARVDPGLWGPLF